MGRSKQAQDLLFQTIRESRIALAVVVEPYRILDIPNWVGDLDGLVAMTWTSAPGTPAAGILLEQGKGYAAIDWNGGGGRTCFSKQWPGRV